MKVNAVQHPKTLALKSALQTTLPTVVGHLELLWHFTAQHAPRGDIGKWSNAAISGACYWDGDADAFVEALITSGYVEQSEEFRLVIHDWPEHCPQYVRAALSKKGITFATSEAQQDLSLDGDKEGSSDPSIQAKPNLTKPSQAKTPSESSGAAQAPPAATVIALTLNDHSEYPITEELVEEWRGLFPAVDIEQELRKMRAWLTSNPKNRKTRRGILKFVTNWLSRQQDSARPAGAKNAAHRNLSAAERVRAANRERIEREGDAWN